MQCPCGAEMKETFSTFTFYSVAKYNEKGELEYAICHHGHIVVDNRKEIVYNKENTKQV